MSASKIYSLEVLGPKGDVIGWVEVDTEVDTKESVILKAQNLIAEYEMLEKMASV